MLHLMWLVERRLFGVDPRIREHVSKPTNETSRAVHHKSVLEAQLHNVAVVLAKNYVAYTGVDQDDDGYEADIESGVDKTCGVGQSSKNPGSTLWWDDEVDQVVVGEVRKVYCVLRARKILEWHARQYVYKLAEDGVIHLWHIHDQRLLRGY